MQALANKEDLLKLGRGAVEHDFHCEHSTTRTEMHIYITRACIGPDTFAGVPTDPSGVGMGQHGMAQHRRTCGNTLPRACETVLGVEGGDRHGGWGRGIHGRGPGRLRLSRASTRTQRGSAMWRRC